jgi:hypothetical protein
LLILLKGVPFSCGPTPHVSDDGLAPLIHMDVLDDLGAAVSHAPQRFDLGCVDAHQACRRGRHCRDSSVPGGSPKPHRAVSRNENLCEKSLIDEDF